MPGYSFARRLSNPKLKLQTKYLFTFLPACPDNSIKDYAFNWSVLLEFVCLSLQENWYSDGHTSFMIPTD
jgi:hypothetical protein